MFISEISIWLHVESQETEKLSLITKALFAYKPGTPGPELLLNQNQLSLIVKQLSYISSDLRTGQYSPKEILIITKSVTRVGANCSGLVDEGIEEVLCCLLETSDETTKIYLADISNQIVVTLADDPAVLIDEEVPAPERECDCKYIIIVQHLSPSAPQSLIVSDICDLLYHLRFFINIERVLLWTGSSSHVEYNGQSFKGKY